MEETVSNSRPSKRIVCIGECMLELSERGAGSYQLGFAGDTFNTCWYLRACLGPEWHIDFVSAVGDDHYSDQMLSFFALHGFGTTHIRRIGNRRPGLYIIRQSEGDRHFTYWRGQSAAKQLADDEVFLRGALHGADLVYFSGITLAILDESGRGRLCAAIKVAKRNGAQIAFDPNERPALWESAQIMRETIEQAAQVATFVFPTFPDEQLHFHDKTQDDVATRYLAHGAREVVVKNGAAAALLATASQRQAIAPHTSVQAIDPTGAGDSFNGAYLAARLQDNAPAEAVTKAHHLAGIVITYPGALVPVEKLRSGI
jgi:2-dehydro-3-deoxygluconokinase